MGVIGGAGGYATVNPTQGNPIMEAMQNVENSAFKYNAQRIADDRTRQDAIQAEQDLRDSRLKEDIAYADKHKITPTTIGSVNKAVLDFSVDNKNMYSQAKNILRTSNDPEERRAATETMTNLESSFEIAKALPEMLNASAKDLEEGVRQGKYNPESSTLAAQTIEAMNKGDMKVVFKPNGIPTFITYKRDENGNLTEIIDKELTLDQLKQKLTPIMAFDPDTNNADFKKGLKEKTKWTDKATGRIKEGYQGIEVLAENNANSVISNRDKMYGIAPSAGVKPKMNLADYTKEELEKVKSFIVDGFIEGYKPSDERDYQAEQLAISRQAKADAQRNSDRTYQKDVAGKKTVKTAPLTNKYTGQIEKDKNGNPIMVTSTSVTTYLSQAEAKKEKQPEKAKKEISRKDIASKAKASGYSVKEYEALLIKNGVTIK